MDPEIVEIIVKYKSGKGTSYKGEQIERFIEHILDTYELSGEESKVQEGRSFQQISLNYKQEKGKSPGDLAKEMQKQAAGKLKF